MKPHTSLFFLSLAFSLLAAPTSSDAQVRTQGQNQGQSQGQNLSASSVNTLPPALRAALITGNGNAVTQAINTLAAGNPQRAAELAASVVIAAESLLSTNPQGAVQAAAAAVAVVQSNPVQTSAPQQTVAVLTGAARIFVAPVAAQVAPNAVLALATATLQAAATLNDPNVRAAVAFQAANAAERALPAAPAAAVQLVSLAVQVVRETSVLVGAPAQSLNVVSVAARVVVSPEAQQAAPQAVASVATTMTQIATTPIVYAANPTVALTVLTNAYATVSSPTIAAAVPSARENVVVQLTQAASSTSLSAANANNSGAVNEILSTPAAAPVPTLQPPPQSTPQQPLDTTTRSGS